MKLLARFFDLDKLKLDRSHPAKNTDHNLEFGFVRLHIFDDTGKVQERTVNNTDRLADFKRNFRLRSLPTPSGWRWVRRMATESSPRWPPSGLRENSSWARARMPAP